MPQIITDERQTPDRRVNPYRYDPIRAERRSNQARRRLEDATERKQLAQINLRMSLFGLVVTILALLFILTIGEK